MSRGWDNRICDKKALVKGLLFVGTMLLACKFTHSIAYVAFYPLIMMAFMSRKLDRALLCILLMASFLCVNTYFVPKSAIYALLQRGGIILMGGCMFFSLLSRGVSPAVSPLLGVLVYVSYMIIPSVCGWSMIVSLLKIFLYFATLTAWMGMGNIVLKGVKRKYIRTAECHVDICLLYADWILLLLAVPQIGQMGMADLTPDEIASRVTLVSLFQGMTNHSQALGPVAAMTLVLVLGDYVFGVRKVHILYNVLIFCGVIILWKTSSRTAMATFLFGAGVIFFTILKARLPNVRWKGKVKGAFVATGFLVLIAVLLVPLVRERALKFIVKYHANDSLVLANVSMDDITSSRQGAFKKPLANWRKKPAIGNGFQVSEDMSYIKAKSMKELLTAPVEKGTWIVAVLEEGGIFGMVILCVWIITVYHLFTRRKLYIGRALFCTFLVANLGEFSMFSLSYIGSIEWVLIMAGVILDNARLREVKPTSRFDYRFTNLAQPNFETISYKLSDEVVHITNDLAEASGVGTFIRRVQGELVKLGVDSQVVTSRGELFDCLNCLKLFDSSPLGDSDGLIQQSNNPTIQQSNNQTIQQSTPDLIFHLHGMWLGLHHAAARWARKHGVTVVWSTHGMTAPWSMRHKWWKKLPAWWLYQKRDLQSTAVIHCTTDLEVGWNQALGLKKTCVVPLGTDLPETKLECRVGVRERTERILLFVGRIYPVKAIDRIIKAFQMVPHEGWRLRIVGPDQDGHLAELRKIAGAAVDFVGPKFGADLAAEYARCDCAILASHTENFGATIVDAMAHGKPVIAGTKTPWKIVAEKGCGWWVDNDPEVLSKTMDEMMSLSDAERVAMGTKGRRLVEEKYTWAAVGRAMLSTYESLLKR